MFLKRECTEIIARLGIDAEPLPAPEAKSLSTRVAGTLLNRESIPALTWEAIPNGAPNCYLVSAHDSLAIACVTGERFIAAGADLMAT
ncbi:MAG TPA: hypothetical protein P5081_17935 [Phycisphaerae bacterium]|nr:hypothetical protein [Phycisphaerae bacterium]HRW54753.1 hypothetical protein [Phycisphaerae bacterium]